MLVRLRVQMGDHFQPFLVQIFVQLLQMRFYFEEVLQIFVLKRVGGAPMSHPFAHLAQTMKL